MSCSSGCERKDASKRDKGILMAEQHVFGGDGRNRAAVVFAVSSGQWTVGCPVLMLLIELAEVLRGYPAWH